jgi:hypothetical protein
MIRTKPPKAVGGPLLTTSFTLSLGTTVLLLAYWVGISVGAAGDGLGWLLATALYTVMVAYLGGFVLGAAAAVTATAYWSRFKEDRRAALAIGCAAAALALWIWLALGGPVPRGPLG